MKINIFWGDLPDISAKKEALIPKTGDMAFNARSMIVAVAVEQ